MVVVAVLVAIVGVVMIAAPDGVASASHALRISAPAPDSAGRVASATRMIGLAVLAVAVVLVAVALFS